VALTTDQLQAIREKLTELFGAAQCPMCKNLDFFIEPEVAYMPVRGGISAFSFPCLIVVCTRCGTAQFASVFRLGLQDVLGIKAAPPEEAPPKQPEAVPQQPKPKTEGK
jgi:hypothetical protein